MCRRLLAQVCLVREEVQNVARTTAFSRGGSWTPSSDKTAQLRGGVPRRAVAFLQVALGFRDARPAGIDKDVKSVGGQIAYGHRLDATLTAAMGR